METALDVLSRAASLVETTTEEKGESSLSGCPTLDSYELGPGKELPSRSLKAERLKERQDLVHVLAIDKDRAASLHARKTVTASTQTQFSSFNGSNGEPLPSYPGPPPPGPPPAYFAPRGDPIPGDRYSPVHHTYRPPPPLPPLPPPTSALLPTSASASSHLVDLSRSHVGSDMQNTPLNLSLSSSPSTVSSSSSTSLSTAGRLPPRESVITCMSTSSSSRESGLRAQDGHGSPTGHSGSPNGHRRSPNRPGSPCGSSAPVNGTPAVSDPAIEEHFRRSLGKSYGDSAPKTTPATTTASDQANVFIMESVDDHFAKALGDSTWKAIQSQNDPPADTIFSSSVDDHFAKALGATTWQRIKAETEHSDTSSSNSSNHHSPNSSAPTSPPHHGTSISTPVAT